MGICICASIEENPDQERQVVLIFSESLAVRLKFRQKRTQFFDKPLFSPVGFFVDQRYQLIRYLFVGFDHVADGIVQELVSQCARALSTTIVLSSGGTYTAHFGGNQWPANAMWVEPLNVTLTGDSATVGYRFNVTVWLNMTQNIYSYQVGLLYNRTQLKCDRAGFTGDGTSEYFTGHYSCTEMRIDTSYLGNGSVFAGECCIDSDCIVGPRAGSLIWLEFEVVAAPPSNMSFTSMFDINTKSEDESQTYVQDCNLNLMNLALHNGNYEILGSDVSLGLASATMQSNAARTSVAWNMLCVVLERRRRILACETFCTV